MKVRPPGLGFMRRSTARAFHACWARFCRSVCVKCATTTMPCVVSSPRSPSNSNGSMAVLRREMSYTTARIFVDTHVFVYAKQAREPVKQPLAAQWLERLWSEQSGRTSVQVLNEYYATMTRKVKPAVLPADAWDDVKNLMVWNPQAMDLELLHRGREVEQRYRLSWWDSLIVAAAQLQNCVLLLTE